MQVATMMGFYSAPPQVSSGCAYVVLLHILSMAFQPPSPAVAAQSGRDSNYTDQVALLGFKSLITDDPSNALSSWREGSSVCTWTGVRCNHHHRVSILDLRSLGLAGRISTGLGNLSALRSLYLQSNHFAGAIPNQLGVLGRLQTLNASTNHLTGSIPWGLTNCTDLEIVDLSANTISGVIPAGIHLLQKLQILKLGQNQLTGTIPPSIGNLSSLATLDVGTNNLTGEIPSELGRLRRLQYLQLSINNLKGEVPGALYNLSNLTMFALASNDLHGEIPGDVGLWLPNLRVFHFCINKFTGPIPPSLHNVTKIQSLRMSHNFLTGNVPPGLGHLPDLVMYNIGFNKIVDSTKIVDALTNSTKLQFLAFDENLIEGTLPRSVGNLSSSLAKLYLGGNKIIGQIPPSIGRLTALTLLNMSYNQLSGHIPKEIGLLTELNVLGLAGNNLSGPIPAQLGNLVALTKLEMSKNRLAGRVPEELGRLQRTISLDLSENNLFGSIPSSIFTLASLSFLLNLSHNSLTGALLENIGQLENIIAIDLSHNLLDGSIPTSIGKCQSLQYMSMRDNALSGMIPDTIGNLKGLLSLDLSANQLSGSIPYSLTKLQALQLLNLSSNDLDGMVPSGGIFKNHSVVFLDGNPKLCRSNSACFHSRASSHRRKVAVVIAVAVASTAILLVLLMGVVLLSRRRLGNAKPRATDTSIRGKHPVVSYEELCRATNNFDQRNLIGVGSFGSVYKAMLHDGMPIAIKVLDLEKTGASKSWVAECEAVRNVRHRNLVRLITLCASIDFAGNDFRALVYELMSNGSLEDWIRGTRRHENGAGLDATEMLGVAIDVASALEYMHFECGGQIVHCDIKPSNVLLDGDITAKVGDFGLARLLAPTPPGQESISSTHRLKGSIGYIPPEYGYGGKPSTRGDVYSYGVMLLEMITGKSPVDESFGGDMNLEKWVRTAFPHRASEVIDEQLMDGHKYTEAKQQRLLLESLVRTIEVALSCVAVSPDERSNMRDVLVRLKLVQEDLLKPQDAVEN